LGRTLAELDETMGSHELQLWAARDEIDGMVNERTHKTRGLTYSQALDQVRANWQAHMRRKR
jgi:hypothetical protein